MQSFIQLSYTSLEILRKSTYLMDIPRIYHSVIIALEEDVFNTMRLKSIFVFLDYSLSERDERAFEENVWTRDVCKSKTRGLLITYCLRFFMGTLVPREKTLRYRTRQVMKFGFLVTDIPVYVF